MKKIGIFAMALVLLVVTVFSASAVQIESIVDQDVHVGTMFSYDVKLEDYTNVGDLTFSLISFPDGMVIDGDGKITWSPLLKQAGDNLVVVNVSNGTSEDTESFNLKTVFNSLVLSLNTNNAPKSASVDSEYRFSLVASSNYPSAIEGYSYSLIEGPSGMSLVNNELIWSPTIDQIGSHVVRVSAIPFDAPTGLNAVEADYAVSVQGMTIDRVEVRTDSRRLETISRSSYISSSTPYTIDRDARLGDTIELRVSIRNNLPSSSDNELRDVEIELYSFDLYSADGEEAFISRIRSGRTEDQTLSFYLDPLDLHPDDSPFDLEIRVSGETRDGDFYSDVWFLELRLESNSYDLLMFNEVISPASVCAGERLRVSFDLRNIGTRDLSSAGVRYNVPELGIDEWDRNFRLDYDEQRFMNRFLTIPSDALPGDYFVEVTAYPRLTSNSDLVSEIFLFSVDVCEPVVDDEVNVTEPIVISPSTPEVVVPGTPVSEGVGTRSGSVFDTGSNFYVVLLTALVVLLLVGVILLLVYVIKK